jgi:hypothetical protein
MSPRDASREEQAENARHRVEDLKRSYGPISGPINWAATLGWIGALTVAATLIGYLLLR